EIGPGIGTMTQYLSEAARQVLAVEIDHNLIPILQETLADYDNVEVLEGDILKQDIQAIADRYNQGKPIKVVANLPYYITTPIIMELFESHVPLASVTVMVQEEVADRMKAGPGTKDYGALSLAVQYYSKPYVAVHVPANCFMPRPKVGSAVIHLDCLNAKPIQVNNEKLMFQLIRASFNQRRKTLQNGLTNSSLLPYSKDQVGKAIESVGLSPSIRGEKLGLQEFAALADALERRR
nr:16S rRNA (adenine(1518)-N(6)/adenine(1519)-N(6))-dimethyltransferase RsmA [Eubacterium sp.]